MKSKAGLRITPGQGPTARPPERSAHWINQSVQAPNRACAFDKRKHPFPAFRARLDDGGALYRFFDGRVIDGLSANNPYQGLAMLHGIRAVLQKGVNGFPLMAVQLLFA